MKFLKQLLLPGLVALTAACLLTACCSDNGNCRSNCRDGGYCERDGHSSRWEGRGKRVDFSGKVYYDRSEGGHYMIKSDAGHRYHPLNLASRYERDGLRVRVTGVTRGPAMGGSARALEIDDIDRL